MRDVTATLDHYAGGSAHGRWLELRAVAGDDYPYLEQLIASGAASQRWRLRGRPARPEQLRELLWQAVLAQYTVIRRRDNEPCGLAVLHDADLPNGTAWAGLVVDPQRLPRGPGIEAFILLVEQAFCHWDLRKLYAQVPEYNMEQFANGVRKHTRVEARLRKHEFHFGRYWDSYVVAIWREQAETYLASYRQRIARAPVRHRST